MFHGDAISPYTTFGKQWWPNTNPTALAAHVKCSMVMPYRPTQPLEKVVAITNPMALVALVKCSMVLPYRPTPKLEKSSGQLQTLWPQLHM